jgi:hypothetical protein
MGLLSKKPPELTIRPSQLILLTCDAEGCKNQANPENAVVTGVLGIGKAVVHFCDTHERIRREKLAEYSFKKKEKTT